MELKLETGFEPAVSFRSGITSAVQSTSMQLQQQKYYRVFRAVRQVPLGSQDPFQKDTDALVHLLGRMISKRNTLGHM